MAQFTSQTMQMMSKEESREMMALWPDIVRDIREAAENLNIPNVAKWMEKVLEYNILGGKRIRGLALIYAYKMLIPNDQLKEDNIHLARILAWCLEIMHSYYLLIDDIIDRSLLRRGKPCWYRYNNIGEAAANDGILLDCTVYYIIRKYFNEKECYVDLIEVFHDITFKTSMGECLELCSTNFNKKLNLDLFTMDRYKLIIESKTAYCTYVLPVITAMHLAGIKNPEMIRQATSILLEIGCFFQIQDDYLTCFGDSEVSGKDDTDIQEGKCTWFVVKALECVTPEQRKILEECYGASDPKKIKRVKQLFDDLNLRDAYSAFEEETYNLINVHIQQISCGLPHNLFSDLLEQIYRRVV